MRVTSYAVARPSYYDRTAVGSTLSFESAPLAPHGTTTRWTTAIAAGKKAYVESGIAFALRSSAAATSGAIYVYHQVNSGATSGRITHIGQQITTVGTSLNMLVPTQVTLYAGDQLTGFTADQSTGGTCDFICNAKLTTFDA